MKPAAVSRAERFALPSLVFSGVALRLWQYFANTSLWIDEIALAENVIRTPLPALVREPLALDQVAPPGFLAALKLASAALGPTELALRLVPLACGIAGLLLFALLAWRTRPGWSSVFAVGLFAFSPPLIAHSAEAKQYSTDVFVSVALTLIAFSLRDRGRESGSRLLVAGLAGALAVWFSAGAVFLVAGLGAGLLLPALRDGPSRRRRGLVAMLGFWAASAAAAVAHGFDTLTPDTREYMRHFWEPSLPRPTVLALVSVSCLVLWKARPRSAPLLIGPTVAALVAAAAHLYPFSGRAILFLTPVALLAVADGAGLLVDALGRLRVPKPIGAACAVLLAATTSWHPPVYRSEETRPVLANLAAQQRPGDVVYVYYGAERAMRFYGPRVGIEPSGLIYGSCHRGQPREYLRELDGLRGRSRVWVVIAHASPSEQDALLGYLGTIGRRRGTLEGTGAVAELYDLSDPERLRASSAATYSVSESDPAVGKRFGCGHGGLSATPEDWK